MTPVAAATRRILTGRSSGALQPITQVWRPETEQIRVKRERLAGLSLTRTLTHTSLCSAVPSPAKPDQIQLNETDAHSQNSSSEHP